MQALQDFSEDTSLLMSDVIVQECCHHWQLATYITI